MALIEKLKKKEFNLDGLDVKEMPNERTVKISKTVKNDHGDDVPMSIAITFNHWGRGIEFDFLKRDDCYIEWIYNGAQEQQRRGRRK